MRDPDSDFLAPFFDAARSDTPPLSAELAARIAADAEAAAVAASRRTVPGRPASQGLRRTLGDALAALGGWPAWSGLAAAGVAGFWIGVAAPAGLDAWQVVDAYRIDPDALVTGYADIDWGLE